VIYSLTDPRLAVEGVEYEDWSPWAIFPLGSHWKFQPAYGCQMGRDCGGFTVISHGDSPATAHRVCCDAGHETWKGPALDNVATRTDVAKAAPVVPAPPQVPPEADRMPMNALLYECGPGIAARALSPARDTWRPTVDDWDLLPEWNEPRGTR
jgi:hypothetical protein